MTLANTSHAIVFHLFTLMSLVNAFTNHQWVVVVSVSEWYDEIFQNWLFWYKHLNLDMDMIVVAEDIATYEKYNNCSGFTTMYFDLDEVRQKS